LSEIQSFKDKCGVFGITGHRDASYLTMFGLHTLQHRGQESCGIASIDGSNISVIKHEGLVSRTFTPQEIEKLQGNMAIGHVRYSTSGDKNAQNSQSCIQPFCGQTEYGNIAIAHNGNLVDYTAIKQQLLKDNVLFTSNVDTEIILHLIIRSNEKTLEGKIFDAVTQIKGAFSIVIVTENFICAVRDRNGIRPLCLGEFEGSAVVSSESCAITAIGGQLERDILAGEVLFLYNGGKQKQMFIPNVKEKFCIFEFVYFSRPDTHIDSKSVYTVRKNIGKHLALEGEHTIPNNAVVVPVPDSGIPSAMGFAEASGIPFEFGIVRNHYIGRTFIDPSQSSRASNVNMKHAPNVDIIKGKKVILVDDSIVRGTTSRKIVELVRGAGASEIHLKIACPPTKFPCFYGIDTPCKEDLIANQMTLKEMEVFLGVDSLQYISIDGLKKACVGEKFCLACFDGDYFV
jgi:amidophosphoribosyltransferase